MQRVYLDWNATSPPRDEVIDAMSEVARSAWGNPSSIHGDGRRARAVVEDARAAVGELTGFEPRDVVLTAGGTEANNLALRSAFARAAPSPDPPWLVTSRLEHPSVTRVAEVLEREGRARVWWLEAEASGAVALADLERALEEGRGRVALVTVQAVNNETGVVQPFAEVIARAKAAGARVHVDAVQAWGKIEVAALRSADSASLAAHKIRGPKGIGALVTRPSLELAPVLVGGAQERGVRPGTVDPVLAAGLMVAARHAAGKHVQHARIAELRDRLEQALLALGAGARVVGDTARRAAHVSTLVWPGWVGAELVAALDLEGVSVSSGSACSAGTIEPSPVLRAMLGDEPLAASGVRASLGELTSDDDVARAVAAFAKVVARR